MRYQASEVMGTATAQDLVIMKNFVSSPQPLHHHNPHYNSEPMLSPPSSSATTHCQMLHMRQQQMMHLQHLQQTATSQPRFQQTLTRTHSAPYSPSSPSSFGIPSSSSSSLKAPSPMKLATRAGRRASMVEDPDVSLFVSPLSVEPRQRHLARQKLKFTYHSDVPESMVVQSSCGLHSYRVEAPKSRMTGGEGNLPFHSPHFASMGIFMAGESPSSATDGEASNDGDLFDDVDDPVICSSPRLDNPLSSDNLPSPSSRGLTPEHQAPTITLMDRLHELEQMMGSSAAQVR